MFEVDVRRVLRVGELQDRHRAAHRADGADSERQDLDRHVGLPAQLQQPLQLLAHDCRTADDSSDHGFVHDCVNLERVGAGQDALTGHPSGDGLLDAVAWDELVGGVDGAGVVLGLEQAWHEQGLQEQAAGRFGLQSDVGAELPGQRVEVLGLLKKLDQDEQAVKDDLPDLVRFFLGTGERTGEALGAHWPDFNEEARELAMSGNVIRARGRGRIVNRGKTENAERPIPLPDWCVAMLVERRSKAADLEGPIFPSSTGTIREATNVRNRAWKPFIARAGYEWVTFRTFRRTVATLLDEAGLTARQIADLLGHSRPSMTQDVYMGRRSAGRAAADALGAVIRVSEG